MLNTIDVTFSYNQEFSFNFPNIELGENESLLILGESGIGKTTLLHLLAGILSPSKGKIIINNKDITKINAKKLDAFRGKNIGLIFQNTIAITSLTVFQNLQARLYFSGIPNQKEEIENILTQLDLLHINPGAIGTHGFHKARTMVRFEIEGKQIKNLEVIEFNR